jgi:hypothetical protein
VETSHISKDKQIQIQTLKYRDAALILQLYWADLQHYHQQAKHNKHKGVLSK